MEMRKSGRQSSLFRGFTNGSILLTLSASVVFSASVPEGHASPVLNAENTFQVDSITGEQNKVASASVVDILDSRVDALHDDVLTHTFGNAGTGVYGVRAEGSNTYDGMAHFHLTDSFTNTSGRVEFVGVGFIIQPGEISVHASHVGPGEAVAAGLAIDATLQSEFVTLGFHSLRNLFLNDSGVHLSPLVGTDIGYTFFSDPESAGFTFDAYPFEFAAVEVDPGKSIVFDYDLSVRVKGNVIFAGITLPNSGGSIARVGDPNSPSTPPGGFFVVSVPGPASILLLGIGLVLLTVSSLTRDRRA